MLVLISRIAQKSFRLKLQAHPLRNYCQSVWAVTMIATNADQLLPAFNDDGALGGCPIFEGIIISTFSVGFHCRGNHVDFASF